MRDPDALVSPAAQQLGALSPTAVTYDAKPRQTPAREAPAAVAAIRLARHPTPRPYPLRGGELVLPSGLIVHRVPKGISVRTGREQQTADMVWEIADARGRRLALIKERSFRRAAASTASVLDQTATVRVEEKRGDWDDAPVRVIVDRFRADDHIYTLERRARGTGWIMSNLELAERSARRVPRRD